MEAFQNRQSVRSMETTELPLQDLSDLLWAANGINRPESGKRTAPSAMDSRDVDVYVCRADGAYEMGCLDAGIVSQNLWLNHPVGYAKKQ